MILFIIIKIIIIVIIIKVPQGSRKPAGTCSVECPETYQYLKNM